VGAAGRHQHGGDVDQVDRVAHGAGRQRADVQKENKGIGLELTRVNQPRPAGSAF